ncbi:hypothetical protein C8Q76DRAFT_758498 [Earliella scabrosa]|nr:hypothetical protein C8Q76DRAFT_758498 [Earliella scabrosa]
MRAVKRRRRPMSDSRAAARGRKPQESQYGGCNLLAYPPSGVETGSNPPLPLQLLSHPVRTTNPPSGLATGCNSPPYSAPIHSPPVPSFSPSHLATSSNPPCLSVPFPQALLSCCPSYLEACQIPPPFFSLYRPPSPINV